MLARLISAVRSIAGRQTVTPSPPEAIDAERLERAVRRGRRIERERWERVLASPAIRDGNSRYLAIALLAETSKPAADVIALISSGRVVSLQQNRSSM